MIHLTKGQPLFENPGMVVSDPTGYYEDGTSVLCAMFFAPDDPVCRFEAKYVAYGGQVYTITDESALMEEINKIDPNTLFGKSNSEVMVDKMVNNIQTVESQTGVTDIVDSAPAVEEPAVDSSATSTPTLDQIVDILPEEEVVIPDVVMPTSTPSTIETVSNVDTVASATQMAPIE